MPQHQSVSAARKPASDKSIPNLGRHARKCAICNHPDRNSIDSDFISWRSATTITLDYELSSRSIIYRHAAATGLLEPRQRNLRGVCERIMERVDEAPPSASAVLRALRVYAQISEDGHWAEPAKRSIVTHIHITKHDSPLSPLGATSGVHSDASVGAPSAERGMVSVSAQSDLTVPAVPLSSRSVAVCPQQSARLENPREGAVSAVPAPSNCDEGREAAEFAAHDNEQLPAKPAAAANKHPNLEYIPHWARGLYPEIGRPSATATNPPPGAPKRNGENGLGASPSTEILIGTQNASRGESTR